MEAWYLLAIVLFFIHHVKGCSDRSTWCYAYKSLCTNKGYISYVKEYCKKTCNYCDLTTTTRSTPTTKPYTGAGGRAVQPGCGIKGPTNTRIVGGTNAKPGAWPWQVTIDASWNTLNKGHLCGAILITNEWVLSAAHCFYKMPKKDYYWLTLGQHNLKISNKWEQRFNVSELLLHPRYNDTTFDYDLALLRLNGKATFNSRVQAACLPGNSTSFATGTRCFISGWGYLQQFGSGPAILQQASVPLVDHETCRRAFYQENKSILTGNMICAGYSNATIDSCQGDSGGPLVCKHYDASLGQDIWYASGTISWGIGCARRNLYGVFSNIKGMRPWLDQVVFKGVV